MNIKNQGVVVNGLKPEMWYYAGRVDQWFQDRLGSPFTITNAVAGREYASFHGRGLAIDGRTFPWFDGTLWRHTPALLELAMEMKNALGPLGYDLVLEPDWLPPKKVVERFASGPRGLARMEEELGHRDPIKALSDPEQVEKLRRLITPHLHGEFDQKPGEVLWPLVD